MGMVVVAPGSPDLPGRGDEFGRALRGFSHEAVKRQAASAAKYGFSVWGKQWIINMAISQSQALNRMEGLSAQVGEHLAKIAGNPLSRDVPHWKTEIRAWLGEIERLNQHVGKKTGQEWASRIAAWKGQLGE